MQNSNFDETQPTPTEGVDETQPTEIQSPEQEPEQSDEPVKRKRFPWGRVILLAWLLLIAAAALGAYGGYQQGIDERISLQATEAAEELGNQYQLGLEDFDTGEYERARQRFEYLLEKDPNNAKAIEMLARTLAIIQATATPTQVIPTATPTLTPTPDMRGVEELFEQAQAYMVAEDWDGALGTLLTLRKNEPGHEAIQVDSMLYVALRNRGVYKILNAGELEGGLYDLAQAELFGPLDAQAENYRDWARFYIIGASFWGVDWGQAAYYFGQVAFVAPNLHDGTGWTATVRYREALGNYVDLLIEGKQWCLARDQHEALRALDPSLTGTAEFEQRATMLHNRCESAQNEDDDGDDGDG